MHSDYLNTKLNNHPPGSPLQKNGSFQAVYNTFLHRYNEGGNPADISKQLLSDCKPLFDGTIGSKNYSLFGLAMAQWDTKSLDVELLNQVKGIIESGEEIERYRKVGENEKMLKKRETVLQKFLEKITSERKTAKRRVESSVTIETHHYNRYHTVILAEAVSPVRNMKFIAREEHGDDKYLFTSGFILLDALTHGTLFTFKKQGAVISAKWVEAKVLEIGHDSNLVFDIKLEDFGYRTPFELKIVYVATT